MRRALEARSWTGVALGLTLLAGCGRDTPRDVLFPLEADHRWTYSVATQWSDGNSDQHTLSLTTLGEERLPGGGDQEAAWRRRSDEGIDYWLRADASGIRRIATRALFDQAPRPDPPQRYVLKAPYTVGTRWEAPTTAYLLMRKFDFPREARYTYAPVPMTYRIEADNQSVDTPAGRYTACLRVRGTATMRVYADPIIEWREAPLTTLEWYCPGVGLVRMERTEPPLSTYMVGGTQVLALVSFH